MTENRCGTLEKATICVLPQITSVNKCRSKTEIKTEDKIENKIEDKIDNKIENKVDLCSSNFLGDG